MIAKSASHTALAAAKARWAVAQDHHALRGTPSHEMTRATPTNADYLGEKPLGPQTTPTKP
jgi:hypothetical protein